MPEVCLYFTLSSDRGRREHRVRAAPAVSCANVHKNTHTSIQVQRRQSGIPCAMGYGLYRTLPGVPGLIATVARAPGRELDARVGARGRRWLSSPVHRGEYDISRNPLRRECRIASAEPVCSCAFLLCTVAHETAGAARTRCSLRPLFGGQGNFWQSSGLSVREIAKLCLLRYENQICSPGGANGSRECAPDD